MAIEPSEPRRDAVHGMTPTTTRARMSCLEHFRAEDGNVTASSDQNPWAAPDQPVPPSVVTVPPPPALAAEPTEPPRSHRGRASVKEKAPVREKPVKEAKTDEAWPTREMMAGHTTRPVRAAPVAYKAETPSRPTSALGLTGLVVFALLAAFFAWVTAEPLWLAVGHGRHGTASAIQCSGSGVSQRCVGDFTTDTGIVVERVALLGVDQADLARSEVPAQMVATTSDQAYVGAALRGLHLRWVVGLVLAMLCGVGIALTTGAIRFRDRRTRRAAVATSLAAPLLLLVGFLAAAF